MQVLVILLIASIALAGVFLLGFFWAHRSGQFEDDETPAMRIFFDAKDAGTKPQKQVDNQPQKTT